jgi:CHAD domain-containing protein
VETGDTRAVHAARVASRRLRELLPLLQLDPAVTSKLGRRLRKVTSRLGRLRETDVLHLLTEELHEAGRLDDGSLRRIGAAVDHERARALRRALGRGPAAELERTARKLERIARDLDASADDDRTPQSARAWRWAAEARVARRAAALADAVDFAGGVYLTERLHAVRIGIKKLRYAVELAGDIAGARPRADLRQLKRLQDLLGRMHDLEMLIDRVRQTQAMAVADLAAWRRFDTLVRTLENNCRRLHARYVRERAGLVALCERLSPRRAARRAAAARGQVG